MTSRTMVRVRGKARRARRMTFRTCLPRGSATRRPATWSHRGHKPAPCTTLDESPRCWWMPIAVRVEANVFDLSTLHVTGRSFSSEGRLLRNAVLARARSALGWIGESLIALMDPYRAGEPLSSEWTRNRAVRATRKQPPRSFQGTTPSTKEPTFWGGSIRWASAREMPGHSRLRETTERVTEVALEAHHSLKVFEPPVVLIVVRGMSLATRIPLAVTAVPTAISEIPTCPLPEPPNPTSIRGTFFAYLKSDRGHAAGGSRRENVAR